MEAEWKPDTEPGVEYRIVDPREEKTCSHCDQAAEREVRGMKYAEDDGYYCRFESPLDIDSIESINATYPGGFDQFAADCRAKWNIPEEELYGPTIILGREN